MDLSIVGEKIMALLRVHGKPLSTYKIAKEVGISWGTITTHCYMLKSDGVIDFREVDQDVVGRKKKLWFLIDNKN